MRTALNPEQEAAAAQFPKIRHFDVTNTVSAPPKDDVKGAWVICSPETVTTFSAAGYFFGRELHQKLPQVPIGLVASNWGGTVCEAWASKPALDAVPELNPMFERYAQWDGCHDKEKVKAHFEKAKAAHEKALTEWKEEAPKAKAGGTPVPPAPPRSSHDCTRDVIPAGCLLRRW